MHEIEELLPFATPRQAEKLKALIEHGTHRSAAAALGLNSKSSISDTLRAVKVKAAKAGYAPECGLHEPLPAGQHIKGVTYYYNQDGVRQPKWVKTFADNDDNFRALQDLTDALSNQVQGTYACVSAPPQTSMADLLTIYPQPEPHYGLFSWGRETGEDYDCTIAGQLLLDSMIQLSASAPPSKYAMLSSIGDWFHTDTPDNRTARAGNQLDVDTRWPRVVDLGVEVFHAMVEMALAKHEHVLIKGVGGNHDPQTNYMMAKIMHAYFGNHPRITVDLSPSPFKYHHFGQNLIGINHGDMAKPAELPLIMAADMPAEFGITKYRLWLTGHIHHLTTKEYTGGIIVESLRSLAAKDSWHNASGYRSGRDAKAIVLHRDKGEVQRITVTI